MSLEAAARNRSPSLPGSGRSTPVPRASRRAVEDDALKADKGLRRYGVAIERALSSWEISPQEWADYIAFLGRLLKAIQAHPGDAALLPHSGDIASKLAQCLNPALPSGVHQKALEVYDYIFTTFGQGFLVGHLHEFLPGLVPVLSFASLSVRPELYKLHEDYIVHLSITELRPALKSLLLSLLPALEDDTSEDFDRACRIAQRLEEVFSPTDDDDDQDSERDGYFWQCLFLSVITSTARRQGALNYLVRRLPKFTVSPRPSSSIGFETDHQQQMSLAPAAEAILSPEPGLLLRCFASGLSDDQILVQRGFLDLLLTHIPLDSPVIQAKVRAEDVDRLINAATRVLLRREMSLNRRLWSWFLGPDVPADAEAHHGTSTASHGKRVLEKDRQFRYFSTYGKHHLERCILAMFARSSTDPVDRARPFRICLSLMDRWEIGGSVVPVIFLPAMRNIYSYSLEASAGQVSEVLRSASLFFDGVESMLIWANLTKLPMDPEGRPDRQEGLRMLAWIVRNFNVRDEEMVTVHIPTTAALILCILASSEVLAPWSNAAIDTIGLLLDIVPERLLSTTNSKTGSMNDEQLDAACSGLQQRTSDFYQTQNSSQDVSVPIAADQVAGILWRLMKDVALQWLSDANHDRFGRTVALLLGLGSKLSTVPKSWTINLLRDLPAAMDSARKSSTMSFPAISSLVSLLTWLSSKLKTENTTDRSSLATLQRTLNTEVWPYMSPSRPKYNLEAVKAVWQLHDHSTSLDMVRDTLTALVRNPHDAAQSSDYDRVEPIRRFIVLWNHTVSASGGARKSSTTRRGSTMASTSDSRQTAERQAVLATPLMLVLDSLNDATGPAYDVVSTWIRSTSNLEHILSMQFDLLLEVMESSNGRASSSRKASSRVPSEKLRDLEYALGHFLDILRCEDDRIWQCLGDMTGLGVQQEHTSSGPFVLAEWCASFICEERYASIRLQRKSIDILLALLSGPSAGALLSLELDSRLLEHLMQSLAQGSRELQGLLLRLITLALSLRLSANGVDRAPSTGKRSSISLNRPPQAGPNPSPNSSSTNLAASPPPQLLECLKAGFSSQCSRPFLGQWVLFLSNILPLCAHAIFASLLPLVGCFCKELNKVHDDLVALSTTHGDCATASPELAGMALLEALELVLSQAHELLVADNNAEPEPKQTSQTRSILGNVTAGFSRAESLPSRSTQANSRLTVVLALQDAVRTSVDLWVWSSRYTEADGYDNSSAASASYNALKLRTRTRHLLEQIFAVEPLEALEVVMSSWYHSASLGYAGVALGLLHAMQGLRPKNIVPATLDALCSRTNPTALSPSRLSSQTIDLTAPDIVLFLQAYLESVEDDAMDEIWPDCTAFLRDVLSNPLPYRLVLPGLLSVILLLAQKVDNTNFGEQRKMRRDLGDLFMRLLSATFTTTPASHTQTDTLNGADFQEGGGMNSSKSRRPLSLVSVLNTIMANIETILESPDRVTTATNNVTASLLSPSIHSKTFPSNMNASTLALLLQIMKKSPQAKSWKKELSDAFNDPRLLTTPVTAMENDWFPVFYQWTIHDKERMPELVSRLVAPSSAGIMFGVGASAARLDADRKAQLNVRRICLLLLAAPKDAFVSQLRDMWEKLVELFDANLSSSPSAAVKAELFMLCRALVLSTSTIHLAPLWPVINDNLQAAFMSLSSGGSSKATFGNLALLQACKLLDLLVALSPDEFQLHEWLYITDTTDAVYQPSNWTPSALSDQIAEHLTVDGLDDSAGALAPTPVASTVSGRRRPLIDNDTNVDKGDYKAMAPEDFARIVLRPFLSQLSIHAYEGVYSMDVPDTGVWRRILLGDILDVSTVVS
ncbi:uncharacterized protein LTR77_002980 [Saxophila tyrrhenica]|uniref:Dopey N-terminal domain-containing protein n=1 Tax=Saxophila tyrrhenica TaxID=1690608 RepID=A0AAV9PKK9_9PEZI|nr:hypothetical protein LTR77_002980 [Saxophila tyrrhenica]